MYSVIIYKKYILNKIVLYYFIYKIQILNKKIVMYFF